MRKEGKRKERVESEKRAAQPAFALVSLASWLEEGEKGKGRRKTPASARFMREGGKNETDVPPPEVGKKGEGRNKRWREPSLSSDTIGGKKNTLIFFSSTIQYSLHEERMGEKEGKGTALLTGFSAKKGKKGRKKSTSHPMIACFLSIPHCTGER